MKSIADKLNISSDIRDMAHEYHILATKNANIINSNSMVRGRETKLVAAACLYMACRMKKSPLLLIDFADVIKKDMFKIA